MRVLINAQCLTGAKTGVGHYTQQLARCLRARSGADAIDTFPGFWLRNAYKVWTRVRPWLVRPAVGGGLDSLQQARQSFLQRQLTAAYRRGGYDLYHEPNFIPLTDELPVVTTLHDLSVLLHPQWHSSERVAYFERYFHKSLSGCVHYLAVSEFGRQEIMRTLGLRPDQVTRTYPGVRPELGPLPEASVQPTLRRQGLPPRYLLYVGTIEPRKNVQTLVRAYVELPAAVRERYPLLLVGGWGWNSADMRQLLEDTRHLGVQHVGYVADKHLPALYNGARALVFPTFYEGFGSPPVEMMACGGAVLGSTAGALMETVGKQAHLTDPHDLEGWRQALLRVTTDDDWWRHLRTGAREAVRPFTWDQCAADTLAVYRNLSGGNTKAERPAA